MEFHHARDVVKLYGREFSLKETNVILLDQADSASGPIVVGSRWVEPQTDVDKRFDVVNEIIKVTPELYEFLRCDEPPPENPLGIPIVSMTCAAMRP